MARKNSLDKMSYSELATLRTRIDGLMVEKQAAERTALRQKFSDLARDHGLSLDEVLGKGRRKGKGSVAIKYRDPKNPDNTWTGRGLSVVRVFGPVERLIEGRVGPIWLKLMLLC